MKKIKIILFFVLIAIILSSCRKRYSEDPYISLRSPLTRLISDGGNWHLVKVTVDGVDSLGRFILNNQVGYYLHFYGERGYEHYVRGSNYHNSSYRETSFKLGKGLRNQDLIIGGFLVSSPTNNLTYYILELYKIDLKFKITHPNNGKVYVFSYQKI